MKYTIEQIRQRVESVYAKTVAFRRDLHMHPELSENEKETEAKICAKLEALGIPFEKNIAGHGVCATIPGKNPHHGIALRADIDALPLTEQIDTPYKSQIPGVMHGCGHDMHTAILLGTAEILNEMKADLPGSVRLLFQPSEETIGGAKQMIDAGCLENPKIDSVIGLHVETTVDTGDVQFTAGAMNAASCEFYVTVTGESCHGAHPSDGVDSLLTSCAMVTNLQAIITRRMDPADAALITVGQFHSGTKNNIVSGETKFSGIIRTLNLENRSFIKAQIEQVCTSTAAAYGAQCQVEFHDSYPSLENDDALLTLIKGSAEEALGKEHVLLNTKPSLGADDFAYFCHGSRGIYYNIGVRTPGEDFAYPIHSDQFCPDERAIFTGILTEVTGTLTLLEEESKTW